MKCIRERKECSFSLKWNKPKDIWRSNNPLLTVRWVNVEKSILIKEIFISSLIYTVLVDSNLTKKVDGFSLNLLNLVKKLYFRYFFRGKDFLNYFWFWSVKFFAGSEILSSAKYFEIKKRARKHRLVKIYKNTNITASRAHLFCTKN